MEMPSKTTHRPYQQMVYDTMAEQPFILFDVGMSGGKSKMIVDLHSYHKSKRALIVCPEKVLHVWPEQFEIHAATPFKVFVVEGSRDKKVRTVEEAHRYEGSSVLVISYDTIWREPFNSALVRYGFDTVTLDESHNIKNPQSKRSRYCVRVGKQALRRYACSGTVMADRHTDIYGQMRFIDNSVFGDSFVRFRERYCVMGGFEGRLILGSKNETELAEKIKPYLAFVPQDIIDQDLPPTESKTYTAPLGVRARFLYEEFKKHQFLESEKGVLIAGNSLEKALRLREMTSGYIKWLNPDDVGLEDKKLKRYNLEVIDDTKRQLLEQIINEIPHNEPLVIYAVGRFDLQTIHEVCNSNFRTTSELSGTLNELDLWKAAYTNTLVVQIRSGGTGVEFTRACHNVYYSLSYSLADYQQSQKRSHRTKQTRPVTYHHIIGQNTIDETVVQAISDKRSIIDAIKGVL